MTGPASVASEGLPPHLTAEAAAPVVQHNWLYSVVPVDVYKADSGNWLSVPFLVGYCRQCGRAFSRKVYVNPEGNYAETPMDVEKYGCILKD